MPVQKFRSLDEAREALWVSPDDAAFLRGVAQLWRLAAALAPRRYPRGVYRYPSIVEANRAREAWERR
ncbi:MAG: hypothetical protein Q8Q58_09815 [Candidatus Rokubacteria bacterium]|nr:hypothetical protein [Candidatus Rokubacteria bacterium]